MKVIIPNDLEFISCSVSETDADDGAVWSKDSTYAKDAKVRHEHVTYTSLADSNKGNDPSRTWSGDEAKWKKIGATGPYLMFDEYAETMTKSKAGEHLQFCVKFDRADAFALFNLQGFDLRAYIYDLQGDKEKYVWPNEWDFWQDIGSISLFEYVYNPIVSAWKLVRDISKMSLYEYNYSPIVGVDRMIYTGLPMQIEGKLCVDIDPGDKTLQAGLGAIVVGREYTLGWSEYDTELGFSDYSIRKTDEFGRTSLVRRSSSNTMTLPIYLHPNQADYTKNVLDEVRGRVCGWVGDNEDKGFRSLTLYGVLEDYRMVYAGPNEMRLSLEIQGLV